MAIFQIKRFPSIVASMMNRMKATQTELTDFNIGAVNRTMIEAPAIEIEQLYQEFFQGLLAAIPVATFNSFNFPPLAAIATTGLATVSVTAQATDTLIPAGTVFTMQNGATGYTSQADVTITAGNTNANVLVAAQTAGALGNIAAAQSFTLNPSPAGFVSATNTTAWQNGSDAETQDQQLARFRQFIAALPRGIGASLIYGASTVQLTDANGLITERVATANIVEPYKTDTTQNPGLVDLYVHNGVGSTSGTLVGKVQTVIDGFYDNSGTPVPGYASAGVDVVTAAASELDINLSAYLTAADGFGSDGLVTLAQAAVNTYILGLPIGGTFLLSTANDIVKNIPGVADFVPKTIGNMPAPAAAPTLSSVAAGALGGATYYAKITYVNPKGETVASPESNLAIAANHVPSIAAPPAYGDATGWNVYLSTGTGTETKQNATPIAIGTAFTLPTSGLISGSALPAANTAELSQIPSTGSQKLMPGTTTITPTN